MIARVAAAQTVAGRGCGLPRRNFDPANVDMTRPPCGQAFENSGAGEGNRTLVVSLGSFCSAIELRPHFNALSLLPVTGLQRGLQGGVE